MPHIKDITGQRFGKLVVIRKTDELQSGRILWECKCDCGKTTFALANNLQAGNTTSCGCTRLKKTSIDLTGQRFGQLIAVRPTSKRQNGCIVWECKCDCGETAFANTNNLRSGNTISCGCSRIGKKAVDLTGQRFGKLIAVRPTGEVRNGNAVWECKCDCGETTFVSTTNLRSGNSTSCGCIQRADLTGQRFGKLTAVRPTGERKHRSILWECKCDCGNTKFVPANQLRAGMVKSCGCAQRTDLTGQRFGKLVAVRPADERRKNGSVMWECRCDCGNTAYVVAYALRNGNTQSCGCLRSAKARESGKRNQS